MFKSAAWAILEYLIPNSVCYAKKHAHTQNIQTCTKSKFCEMLVEAKLWFHLNHWMSSSRKAGPRSWRPRRITVPPPPVIDISRAALPSLHFPKHCTLLYIAGTWGHFLKSGSPVSNQWHIFNVPKHNLKKGHWNIYQQSVTTSQRANALKRKRGETKSWGDFSRVGCQKRGCRVNREWGGCSTPDSHNAAFSSQLIDFATF